MTADPLHIHSVSRSVLIIELIIVSGQRLSFLLPRGVLARDACSRPLAVALPSRSTLPIPAPDVLIILIGVAVLA